MIGGRGRSLGFPFVIVFLWGDSADLCFCSSRSGIMKNSFVNARREGLEFSGSELFEKLSSVLGIFEAVFAWRRALESGCWASRAAGFRSSFFNA